MDDNQKITALERKVADLEKWKNAREQQQIVFPLDFQSQQILGNYFMRILDELTYEVVGAAANTITSFTGKQGQFSFEVNKVLIFPYTVNVTTNFITVPEGRFVDDTAVLVYSAPDGAVPGGLAVNTTYYVRDSTGLSFKLAATVGGAAIDITNTGTGRQYIQIIL